MNDVPQPLASALRDRYVLEREVGAGGMATVYLARDLRHKRPVAVKVIRPELAGREGVERFLREIEVVAGLQHPNILPVFDSGVVPADDGAPVPYFVMPYVEGETLRQRLERDGRLPVATAATLAAEVADALAYAHGHGVIHRDIKPENILLSGGHAVVADFGVAKALERGTVAEADASPGITRAGLAIGTPNYMSPEQATGDAIDARSDQYSLGCVLYEMLAGEPPFTGPSPQSVIAKSLSAPRPHLSRVRPEVPPELEQVALRAMAIEPAGRYPDMTALGAALGAARSRPSRGARRRAIAFAAAALLAAAALGGWLATRPSRHKVAPAAETLAVLPFHASGPGMEFLGEGMMDLLATNLRGVGGITTVEPRAVLREWGSEAGSGGDDLTRAISVGRDLGAGSVVLGNAVSTGGKVRVSADLYSVQGERLGRAQVDGPADSVLPLVDRLSVALVRDVWRSKEPIPHLRVAALTTDSIEALRAYLQGEQYYRRLNWDSALTAYNRAVEVDSTFSLAHLRRAQVYGWTGGYGSKESHQAVAAGVRYAGRLSPRDRRLLLGYQLFDQGKPAAIDSLRAFVAANPEDVEGWFLLGEARHHIKTTDPAPPESVTALFDSVIRRDSTLFPAFIHPLDLALDYRDSARFARYFPGLCPHRAAGEGAGAGDREGADLGPPPTTKAVAASLEQSYWPIVAVNSFYHLDAATSDSVLQAMVRVQRAVPPVPQFLRMFLPWKAQALGRHGTVARGSGRARHAETDRLRQERGHSSLVGGTGPGTAGVPEHGGFGLAAGPAGAGGRIRQGLGRDASREGARGSAGDRAGAGLAGYGDAGAAGARAPAGDRRMGNDSAGRLGRWHPADAGGTGFGLGTQRGELVPAVPIRAGAGGAAGDAGGGNSLAQIRLRPAAIVSTVDGSGAGARVRAGSTEGLGRAGVRQISAVVGQGGSGAAGQGERGESRLAGDHPRTTQFAVATASLAADPPLFPCLAE